MSVPFRGSINVVGNVAFYGNIKNVAADTTIGIDDLGKTVVVNSSTSITVTLPSNVPMGFQFELINAGTGVVTVAPAAGETIIEEDTNLAVKNKAKVSLVKISSSVWVMGGQKKNPETVFDFPMQVYGPPNWTTAPIGTKQTDFMTYLLPTGTTGLPVGTIMQFPIGTQPSDWSLLTADTPITDSQWVIPQSVTWTTASLPFTNLVKDVLWTGTQFVVVANGGKIATSSTGLSGSWTNRTSGTTSDFVSLAHNKVNSKICAITGNKAFLSSDGISWTDLGVVNSNATLVAITPMENGFVVLGYGDITRFWYVISISSTGVFTVLKSFQINSTANSRGSSIRGLLYMGDNKLLLGVTDNDTVNNSSTARIYLLETNSLVLTQVISYAGFAGNRIFNFFAIGNCFFVKNLIGSYITAASRIGTMKLLKNAKMPFTKILDTFNYNACSYHKKQVCTVDSSSLIFYRADTNSKIVATNNPISGTHITSNDSVILTFDSNGYSGATYSIATPSANYVTSIPYEPDDGYSWYQKVN